MTMKVVWKWLSPALWEFLGFVLFWGFLFGWFGYFSCLGLVFLEDVKAGVFFFLIEAISMTPVSNTTLQTVKSVLLRDGTGLVTVAGRGLAEAGAAFPKLMSQDPF